MSVGLSHLDDDSVFHRHVSIPFPFIWGWPHYTEFSIVGVFGSEHWRFDIPQRLPNILFQTLFRFVRCSHHVRSPFFWTFMKYTHCLLQFTNSGHSEFPSFFVHFWHCLGFSNNIFFPLFLLVCFLPWFKYTRARVSCQYFFWIIFIYFL